MTHALRSLTAGLALTATLLLCTALAQPSIPVEALQVSATTLVAFLDRSATGGTTGLCYENSAPAGTASYACFERALRVSGFVIGTPVQFGNGSVLIPLGRITLTSLTS